MPLHEVLDMVGGAYDHGYISDETAVELLSTYARISPALAAAMLLTPPGDDWIPVREWDGRWPS